MQAIDIVRGFYESDLANDPETISKFFHKDAQLHWTSSQGFKILNYTDISCFFDGIRQSYISLRFDFTHLLENNALVSTRYTLYANTIENPDIEIALGHFMTIWEIKDNKLFRGYEMSHQADETNTVSMNSYLNTKK